MTEILALLFIGAFHQAQAQDTYRFTVSGQFGYGQYQMGALKEFQQDIQAFYVSEGLPLQTVHDFPGHWDAEIRASIPILNFNNGKLNIGASLGYGSTGGRIHYADFSGEIGVDQVLEYRSLGLIFERSFTHTSQSTFYISAKQTLRFTNLDFTEFLALGDTGDSESLSFKSTSFGLQPQLGYAVFIGNTFVRVNAGYQIEIPSGLTFSANRNAKLIDSSGDTIGANWSGLRLGFMLGMQI